MIPFVAAGRVGVSMLRHLYKGKKKLGKVAKVAASRAGKHGFTKTSKAITGVSKKAHVYSRQAGKLIKKHPKASSAIGGAVLWDILDRD